MILSPTPESMLELVLAPLPVWSDLNLVNSIHIHSILHACTQVVLCSCFAKPLVQCSLT